MNFKEQLHCIKAFVFDVDGVLTDGTVLAMADGEQVRKMNIKDGYALQLAVKKGYTVAVISGGKSEGVIKRLKGLGIQQLYMGVTDKLDSLKELLAIHELERGDVLFMGDDMPDYEVMCYVGLAVCPADAVADIKSISKYCSAYKGGDGCVRDIIEQVMRLHGNWSDETHTQSI